MRSFCAMLVLFTVTLTAAPPSPKLVVFLSVDQMRADYFDRYGKYFTGGLHRLHAKGIVYTNADLNYATSETGPGHASLGTGCYPSASGIHANDWIDPETKKNVYCVEDSTAGPVDGLGGGFSPRNQVVPAIGDWLKGSPKGKNSKVVSISSKDRAAILMGGWEPDGAYWYSRKSGTMTTSDYYMSTLPSWAKEFNASGWIEKKVPDVWERLLPAAEYEKIGPDEFAAEQQWGNDTSFPHPFSEGKKKDQIMGSPFGDQLLMEFALAAVNGEKLGQRGSVDVLCVSFSNCDYVGHGFGPDSHELLDLLVRLDRQLEIFFAELDSRVGKDNYVVALSADHAVCPLPEFTSAFRNTPAKRYIYNEDIKPKLDSLSSLLKYELDTSEDVLIKNSFINYSLAVKDGWDTLALQREITKGLLSIDAFVDVYFRHEMLGTAPSDKAYIQKYRNSYFAPRGEDFQYRIRENCIISSRSFGTTHGSPYRYDTHIPLLFWWNGVKPQKIAREVHSVDAAPTLAKIAGIPLPARLDGVPLKEVVK